MVLVRLAAIMVKELRQLRRDRLTFGMIVGIPLLQLVLFGYAINTDIRNLRAAVADEAGTALSRRVVADMNASQVINVARVARDPQELESLLRRGDVAVGIHLPPDFGRRLERGRLAAAQILVDGTDPTVLGVARQLATLNVRQGAVNTPAPVFEVRPFYNPERRSAINIVPGLIGVILTMTMVLFTAVAIVRERERGNLELLITTPIGTAELMIGKVVPYIGIGLVQVSLILLVGTLLFEVPLRGNLGALYTAALVFIAANLALGLFISTLAQTQFQAMQMTFFFFLPSILLSGFMFPFDGMPRAAQMLAEVLPLTHFVRLVRGIMLRGAELGEIMPDVWALVAFFFALMTAAVLRFSKRLD